jgi:hypothetical protein
LTIHGIYVNLWLSDNSKKHFNLLSWIVHCFGTWLDSIHNIWFKISIKKFMLDYQCECNHANTRVNSSCKYCLYFMFRNHIVSSLEILFFHVLLLDLGVSFFYFHSCEVDAIHLPQSPSYSWLLHLVFWWKNIWVFTFDFCALWNWRLSNWVIFLMCFLYLQTFAKFRVERYDFDLFKGFFMKKWPKFTKFWIK